MMIELREDQPNPNKMAALQATAGLPGRRVIEPDADKLVDKLAEDLLSTANRRVGSAGVFHLALSGGSTPQALYRHLIIDPRYRTFPWPRTHLWIVDDRCVDFDDERSNYKMIRELIVDHVTMEPQQVHPMPVLETEGDQAYERDLREMLNADGGDGRLDMALLGMGGDGHTASLFPDTPALGETERWVLFNDGESVASPRPRMTMTYPLINGARTIAALITGTSKTPKLMEAARAAQQPIDAETVRALPIAGVAPAHTDAELVWYLDYNAAMGEANRGL